MEIVFSVLILILTPKGEAANTAWMSQVAPAYNLLQLEGIHVAFATPDGSPVDLTAAPPEGLPERLARHVDEFLKDPDVHKLLKRPMSLEKDAEFARYLPIILVAGQGELSADVQAFLNDAMASGSSVSLMCAAPRGCPSVAAQ